MRISRPFGVSTQAIVVHQADRDVLVSYDKPVAVRLYTAKAIEVYRTGRKFSSTTSRHINRWIGDSGIVLPHVDIETLAE